MIQNVVIGEPIVEPSLLLAFDEDDWSKTEKDLTMFTQERFLPEIMKQSGIVKSISEVRRNKPELMIELNDLDFLRIKWGKKFLYIVVGK